MSRAWLGVWGKPPPHIKIGTSVIGGSGVLGMLRGKEFPVAPTGGSGFVESFIDRVKLRGSPPRSHLRLSCPGRSPTMSSAGPDTITASDSAAMAEQCGWFVFCFFSVYLGRRGGGGGLYKILSILIFVVAVVVQVPSMFQTLSAHEL